MTTFPTKTRILHLEDLDSDAELIALELRNLEIPYELMWVNDQTKFQNALIHFDPDLVLSDHSLPSFTSREALELVKRHNPHLPFILITATVSEEFAVSMMKNGVEDYLLKDRLQRLPMAIVQVLEKSHSEEENRSYLRETISKERRFRALIENISDAVILIDEPGVIRYCSPSARQITGIRHLAGSLFIDLIHHDDRPQMHDLLKRLCKEDKMVAPFTLRMRTKEKDVIYVEGSVTNLLADEDVNGYTIHFRNISERIRIQNSIQESKANLKTLFDNTRMAYMFVDKELKILSFNEQAQLRYKKELKIELRENDSLLALLNEGLRKKTEQRARIVLQGGKVHYEASFRQPDQTLTWYDINHLPVFSEDKSVLGMIFSSEDITERKRAELVKDKMTKDILQRNKDLEQFTYIISHNLRSPVANILGLARVLKETVNLHPSDLEKCLDGFVSSGKRLDEVIMDLNTILQIRGTVEEKKEWVNFSELLQNFRSGFGKSLFDDCITVSHRFEVENIFTIKSYLSSILFNLISNSFKYRRTDVDSILSIETLKKDDKILIRIKDNGLGIDLEKHGEKMFGLYKRFHEHVEGKGMGLFMVKTQVESLGGTVRVISEVNKGTEFVLTFDANPNLKLENHPPHGLKILRPSS